MENTQTQPLQPQQPPQPVQPIQPTQTVQTSTTLPPSSPTLPPTLPPAAPPVTPVVQKNTLRNLAMIVGALLLVSVVGAGAYYAGTQQAASTVITETVVTEYPEDSMSPEFEGVACTMEAKVCPDGSSVGRTGPNCEFEACPGETEQMGEQVYTNTSFHYTFSYPQTWKVTTENYTDPATPTSENVYVFNPADNPSQTSFSGISISYKGMVQDFTTMTQTTVNGMSMYKQDTMHGENYYVNIPDTDQFLYITGAGGYTDDEARNTTLKQIFASFKFTPFTPSM